MKNNVKKFAWLMILATSSGILVGSAAQQTPSMSARAYQATIGRVGNAITDARGSYKKDAHTIRKNQETQPAPSRTGQLSLSASFSGQRDLSSRRSLDKSQRPRKEVTDVENNVSEAQDSLEADGLNLNLRTKAADAANISGQRALSSRRSLDKSQILEESETDVNDDTPEAQDGLEQKDSGWNFRTQAVDAARATRDAVLNPITSARSAASGLYQGGRAAVHYVGRGVSNAGYAIGAPNLTGRSTEFSNMTPSRQKAIRDRFDAGDGNLQENVTQYTDSTTNNVTYTNNATGEKLLMRKDSNESTQQNPENLQYTPAPTYTNLAGRQIGSGAAYVGRQIGSGAAYVGRGIASGASYVGNIPGKVSSWRSSNTDKKGDEAGAGDGEDGASEDTSTVERARLVTQPYFNLGLQPNATSRGWFRGIDKSTTEE